MKNTKQTNIIIILGVILIVMMSAFPGYYVVQQTKNNNHNMYYLDIPDSPNVPHPTLELDYTADDTAHLNWYWKDYDSSYTTTNPSPLYETDGHVYYKGDILYPDYVHTDTLIVEDADYINSKIHGPDVASDGDIAEILNEGCMSYADYRQRNENVNKRIKEMLAGSNSRALFK